MSRVLSPAMASCPCPRPRIFEDGRCHRCGRDREQTYVSPSSMRTALEITKVALGFKRLREGRPGKHEEAT